MRSYAPAADLGSVTHDNLSSVYDRISGLLSSLKRGAASYLSKLLYHVNIVGKLKELEVQEQTLYDLSRKRFGEIARDAATISQEWRRCAPQLRVIMDEIANSLHNGEPLEPYAKRLDELSEQPPK